MTLFDIPYTRDIGRKRIRAAVELALFIRDRGQERERERIERRGRERIKGREKEKEKERRNRERERGRDSVRRTTAVELNSRHSRLKMSQGRRCFPQQRCGRPTCSSSYLRKYTYGAKGFTKAPYPACAHSRAFLENGSVGPQREGARACVHTFVAARLPR